MGTQYVGGWNDTDSCLRRVGNRSAHNETKRFQRERKVAVIGYDCGTWQQLSAVKASRETGSEMLGIHDH